MSISKEQLQEILRQPGYKLVTGIRPTDAKRPQLQHTGNGQLRRNKYGAQKTERDGIKFDSKKEAARYIELRDLQAGGEISDLKLQPVFVLQEGFTDSMGKRQRAIKYYADFSYLENGVQVVEDVKGKRTAVFNIKWKMLLYRNRDGAIEFRIT